MFDYFMMNDLGATKQILGIKVHRDGKNGQLWLSQFYGEDTDEVQYEYCETGKYPFSFPL
jgi:hypothetical protein